MTSRLRLAVALFGVGVLGSCGPRPAFWWRDRAPAITAPPTAGKIAAACTIEVVVAARRDRSRGTIDCGRARSSWGPPAPAVVAMAGCVVDAIAARRPFLAILDKPGIDSEVATAFVGRGNGYHLSIEQLEYDSDPGGPVYPWVWGKRCGAVHARPDCDAPEHSLCVECVDAVEVPTCVAPPAPSTLRS